MSRFFTSSPLHSSMVDVPSLPSFVEFAFSMTE